MASTTSRKIFLIALLMSILADWSGSSETIFARSLRQTPGKLQAKIMQISVADPGCPGCLLALKKKLLQLSGIKNTKLSAGRKGEIEISVGFDPAKISPDLILDKIRFHDLNVLSHAEFAASSPGPEKRNR